MSKDPLEVSESPYQKVGDGPKEDTGAFYVPTPPPGMARSFDEREPPSGRIAAATPMWIKRVGRPNPRSTAEDTGFTLSPVLIGVAAGAFVIVLLGIAAVAMLWASREPEPQPVPVEEPDQERYQGLKVKKGLQ